MNFLNNFLENELKLNIYNLTENNLVSNFIEFEDMIMYLNYTHNSKYFDYLFDLLKNSFSDSYNNYINNFLVDNLIENLTIFINIKVDFYFEYLVNKIKCEFNYYILLLNKTKELGIGSITSFSNLYKNTIRQNFKRFSESLEDDIIFYINLFYKKNKSVFRKNYINFFINEINLYNIEINGLKDYISEIIIYDNHFNKSLDNISNNLFEQLIIKRLNNTIFNFLNNKVSEVYSLLDELNIKMNYTLSQITKNEDNLNIFHIIMNYQEIILNQNNQFIFKVSQMPFSLLNDFIKDIFEPPLVKIKNQYNIIENKILESMDDSINNFPDYTSILKQNLGIENTLRYIRSLYNIFKNILLKYYDDLDMDLNSYINKLIHYTYINGLYTFDQPCKYSFCKIDINANNNNRYLEEGYNSKNTKHRKLSKKERNYDNLLLNKNINSKRKLYYDETMGSLSKDDIIPFLKDIKNTISQLNKTLQTNFDTKLKTSYNIYVNKINVTYLIKLKKTISMAALKFSTFLTKNSYNKLESDMFKHYYKIENYIYNITNYLNNYTNELILKIKRTSDYLKNINDFTYDKILGFCDTFIRIIEEKFTFISKKEFNNFKKYDFKFYIKTGDDDDDDDDDDAGDPNTLSEEQNRIFNDLMNNIKNENKEIIGNIVDIIHLAKEEISNDLFIDDKDDEDDDDDISISAGVSFTLKEWSFKKSQFNVGVNGCHSLFDKSYPIIIYLVSFPNLQIRIIPKIEVNICFEIGLEFNFGKNEYSLIIDVSLASEISVSLELGLYFPPFLTSFQISFSIGLKGILGSGVIGVKLSLGINNKGAFLGLEPYHHFKFIELYAYILFKFEFHFLGISFEFKFYLYNEKIC